MLTHRLYHNFLLAELHSTKRISLHLFRWSTPQVFLAVLRFYVIIIFIMANCCSKSPCSVSDGVTTPPIGCTNEVQLEDIRLMLADAEPTDTAITTEDFWFSDEDLMDAMRRAIEAFNAYPPQTITADYSSMGTSYMFKVGACWQALLSKRLFLERKYVKSNAGGVSTDIYQPLIEFSKNAANEFKVEFIELVKNYKRAINVSRAWGVVG